MQGTFNESGWLRIEFVVINRNFARATFLRRVYTYANLYFCHFDYKKMILFGKVQKIGSQKKCGLERRYLLIKHYDCNFWVIVKRYFAEII